MPPLSPELDSSARKALTTLLRAVERVGQNTIAQACAVDDSTITGDKAKYWPRFAITVAAAGLKLVPADARCYTAEAIEPLLQLAKQRLAQMQSVSELQWDEPT